MIEPDPRRPGAADDDDATAGPDPAGRGRWDRARRELTVAPPPLSVIVDRARTARRRLVATVATVAAVCATIVVMPLVASMRADDRGPAGPQAPGRTPVVSGALPSPSIGPVSTDGAPGSGAAGTPPSPPGTGVPEPGSPTASVPVVASLSLTDQQRGFAVSQQCDASQGSDARCRYGVWRFDGTAAQPWTAVDSPVPDGTIDDGWAGDVLAFSADRVVIHSVTGNRQKPAWFSNDGGRTWSTVTQRGPVTSLPTGARPTVECVAFSDDLSCDRTGIVVDLPDGSWASLAGPAGVALSALTPAPDGRWWLVGTRGSEIVAGPTTDSGRSWSLTTIAQKSTRNTFSYQLVFAGPSIVWLEAIGQHPDDDVKNGLLAIHRSADVGRTWRPVWTAAPGKEPRSQLGAALGGVDSLQVCAESSVAYRIDSEGRSIELTGCSPDSWREQTSWGYLEHTSGSTSSGRTSADGETWTTLPGLPGN